MSEEVKERKGRGLKIALVVVSTLFVISLLANLYLYTRQYGITPDGGLENQIADLQNQVSNLQNEIENLKSAKLIKINLHGTDTRPWFQTPYWSEDFRAEPIE